MSAIFSTVLAVLFGMLFEEYYAESALPDASGLLLVACVPLCLAPLAAAEMAFLWARRRFAEGKPYEVKRLAPLVAALPLPVFALQVFVLRWPTVVVPLGLERALLVDDLVVLLPFAISLVLASFEEARLRRPLRPLADGLRPAPVRDVRGVVAERFRHLALALVPLLLLLVALDVASDTGLNRWLEHLPLLSALALIALLFVLLVLYPQLFRIGMGLRPLLPNAPLRKRLEELSQRLGFRCRDILYWPMRRPVLNAAIVGVLPRFRYVILTEELCRRLTLDELCAVFAHEVGHGKKHHASYYLLSSLVFLVAVLPLATLVGQGLEEATDGGVDATLAAMLFVFAPAFALYWRIVFGYVSRRFELEADVFGVEQTGNAKAFIETLEKVARIGKIDARAKARRHFSVEGRAEFLRGAFLDGRLELLTAFRQRLRRIRRTVCLAAAAVALVAGLVLGLDSARGAGALLLQAGRPERALEMLDAVAKVRPADPVALALRAEAEAYLPKTASTPGAGASRALRERAPALSRAERRQVLSSLREGFSRALTQGRPDLAEDLLDLATAVNALPDGLVFDAGLGRDLESMRLAAGAIQRGEAATVARLVEDAPRWLRRPDAHPARAWLEAWADERN